MSTAEFRFFLTAEDPRELPKGSRDPLRFIPVWATAGRRMIPYLTTVTPSYRGFLTRFLFHGALEHLESPLANASTDDQWEAFSRFEQLCAIVRSELDPKSPWLPGSTSVPGRVKENRNFTVGSQTSYWLGKSQKTTGFWGYYHQACLGSRVLQLNKADRPGYVLTPVAMDAFRQSVAPALVNSLQPQLEEVFKRKTVELDLDYFSELARFFHRQVIYDPNIGRFWSERLLMPDTDSARGTPQQAFAERVRETLRQQPAASQFDVWETLCSGPDSDAVAVHARQIRAAEAIIGLSEWVLDVCRSRREKEETIGSAREWALRKGYDDDWLGRLRALEEPLDPDLRELRQIALDPGQDTFIPFATALLERHKTIMDGRRSAAWVTLDAEGGLTIREPAEDPAEPNSKSFPSKSFPSGVRWRYDYFLRSWLTAARELGYIQDAAADA